MAEPDQFGNLINWFVGYILMYFWNWLGNILAIFTMWDFGHGNIMATVDEWKMGGISDTYKSNLKLGV